MKPLATAGAAAPRIYLVPGFFGFANLGELKYFGHVRDFLLEQYAARGLAAEVHVVRTPRVLRRAYGRRLPTVAANDGVVPTQSQVWGEVVHVAVADHLDVIGHFRDAAHEPPHFDWLSTG